MYYLQQALEKRLTALRNRKEGSAKDSEDMIYQSEEYIKRSLIQAGILDRNGKMVVISKKE